MMLHQLCRVRQAAQHILAGERRILGQHILNGVAGRQEFKDRLSGDARAFYDGQAVTDVGVHDDLAHAIILALPRADATIQ